jgi:hypothetical protein
MVRERERRVMRPVEKGGQADPVTLCARFELLFVAIDKSTSIHLFLRPRLLA